MLSDYENKDLSITQKLQIQKMIVNSRSCESIKKKIFDHSDSDNVNPFHQLHMWAKGEIYDLHAMHEAIENRDELIQTRLKLEQRKQQYEEEILKINSGK